MQINNQDVLNDRFTNLYPVVKTIKFGLTAFPRTEAVIRDNDLCGMDEYISENMSRIRDIYMKCVARAVSEALGRADCVDWAGLRGAYESMRTEMCKAANAAERRKADRAFETACNETRNTLWKGAFAGTKSVVEALKGVKESVGSEEGVDDETRNAAKSNGSMFEALNANYATVFEWKRRNHSSALTRVVDENFPRFCETVEAFKSLAARCPSEVNDCLSELSNRLGGVDAHGAFSVDSYHLFCTQSGIDAFNAIVGGMTTQDGVKIRGMNELVNELNASSGDGVPKLRLLKPLWKIPLCGERTFSFATGRFMDDSEVFSAIDGIASSLIESNAFERFRKLSELVGDGNGVYAVKRNLTHLSTTVFGNWRLVSDFVDDLDPHGNQIKSEKRASGGRGRKTAKKDDGERCWSLSCLASAVKSEDGASVGSFWSAERMKALSDEAESALAEFRALPRPTEADSKSLQTSEAAAGAFVRMSDAFAAMRRHLSVFGAKVSQDENPEWRTTCTPLSREFYEDVDAVVDALFPTIRFASMFRAYAACRPSYGKSVDLTFGKSRFGNGWSDGYRIWLMKRDGAYYFASSGLRPGWTPAFRSPGEPTSEGDFLVLDFNQINPNSRSAVGQFFGSDDQRIANGMPDCVWSDLKTCEGHEDGTSPVSEREHAEAVHRVVRFVVDWLRNNEKSSWKGWDFGFGDPEGYASLSDFDKRLSERGYRAAFRHVDGTCVEDAVESGRLLMFRITCRDMSPHAHGTRNMNTILFESLFDSAAYSGERIRLLGNMKVRLLRKMVGFRSTSHRRGSVVVNRRTKSGARLEPDVYREIYLHLNGMGDGRQPSEKAAGMIASGEVLYRVARYDIVKDRRFHSDRTNMHVTLKINPNAPSSSSKDGWERQNAEFSCFFGEANPKYVIGIDRGERNLATYAVVDSETSSIVESGSLNTMDGFPYRDELVELERKTRDDRRNLRDPGRIAPLLDGWTSHAVNAVVGLVRKYRSCSIAMENLSSGFRQSRRIACPSSTYTRFENGLVRKLSSLSFKDVDPFKPGGVVNPFQLVPDPERKLKRIGIHGIIRFVSPGYTSAIDPVSGFPLPRFGSGPHRTVRDMLAFLVGMESIVYEGELKRWAFTFKNETDGVVWTAYSTDIAIVRTKDVCGGGHFRTSRTNPTSDVNDAVVALGGVPCGGFDLKGLLIGLGSDPERRMLPYVKQIYFAFRQTVQLRHSDSATGEDFILSPVPDGSGRFFDSRYAQNGLPADADENGAFNIARKSMCEARSTTEGNATAKSGDTWFKYCRTVGKEAY